MKLTKAILRKRFRIFNPRDIATQQNGHKIFVVYSPQVVGRAYRSAKWSVASVTEQTDPNAHWTEHGTKTFHCWHPMEDKEKQRLEALAWATERYGIIEWERSPFGSYHPKGTLEHLDTPAATPPGAGAG